MSWFGRITGIGILLAGLSVGYVYLFSADSESDISAMEDPLTYSVTRLDFEAFVHEMGEEKRRRAVLYGNEMDVRGKRQRRRRRNRI